MSVRMHPASTVAVEPCLYRHKSKDLWLALYVDDALLKGKSAAVAELEDLLNKDFKR